MVDVYLKTLNLLLKSNILIVTQTDHGAFHYTG